jgi:hypothetical protein
MNPESSTRFVHRKCLIRPVLHVARHRIAIIGVLAARQDAHQRFATAPQLVHQPEDFGLRFAPGVAVRPFYLAQSPFELRSRAARASPRLAVDTR